MDSNDVGLVDCHSAHCRCGIPWKEYKQMIKNNQAITGGLPHQCSFEPPVHHVNAPQISLLAILLMGFLLYKKRK